MALVEDLEIDQIGNRSRGLMCASSCRVDFRLSKQAHLLKLIQKILVSLDLIMVCIGFSEEFTEMLP